MMYCIKIIFINDKYLVYSVRTLYSKKARRLHELSNKREIRRKLESKLKAARGQRSITLSEGITKPRHIGNMIHIALPHYKYSNVYITQC